MVKSIGARLRQVAQAGLKGWPFEDHKATIVAMTLSSHNLPTDRARDLYQASTDSGSLLVSI